jgi:PleD family two-component response regulator
MSRIDQLMYQAKESGKNGVYYYGRTGAKRL